MKRKIVPVCVPNLLRSPVSWNGRSKKLWPVLGYEYHIFYTNTAATDVLIDPAPVDVLSVLAASFRVHEYTRDEIKAGLDRRYIPDSKR